MNKLTNYRELRNSELTMSSLEIAELVGSRHADVKRSIERLIEKGTIRDTLTAFFEKINNLGFKTRQEYYLFKGEQGKRDSIIVIAQLCPEFTARLVDRWQELEEQINKYAIVLPDFNDPVKAARAWADEREKNLELESKIQEDAPKVEFMNNFIDITTTKSLRETAKILKMPERAMIDLLIDNHILFRQSGNLLPYADQINKGYFEVKAGEKHGHAYTQTRVTTKGLSYIARRYASELMVA